MRIACVLVTISLAFVAVTVMTCGPSTVQKSNVVLLNPSVFVTGDCPVACQV